MTYLLADSGISALSDSFKLIIILKVTFKVKNESLLDKRLLSYFQVVINFVAVSETQINTNRQSVIIMCTFES